MLLVSLSSKFDKFDIYSSRWSCRYRKALFFFFLQAAIKTRDDIALTKKATFISFSAAPRVHRALSSPRHRDQSANLIWWMNTSQGRVIQGSKLYLSRHLALSEYYCDVGKGYEFVLVWYSVFVSVLRSLSQYRHHIGVWFLHLTSQLHCCVECSGAVFTLWYFYC